jgi:hypothetical protein
MATSSEIPQGIFSPGYADIRYTVSFNHHTDRFLMLLMLGAAWLIDNTANNLRALGKDFSFAFLGKQRGIRYQPTPD